MLLGARFNGPCCGSTAECNEIAPSHNAAPGLKLTVYHAAETEEQRCAAQQI
jgi:hypothetical protein